MRQMRVVVMAVGLGLVGCATVFSGSSQPVAITGAPLDAKVLVDGSDVGAERNPSMKRGDTHQVTVQRPGCPDIHTVVQKNFNGVAILNSVNPVGWIVDAATGSMWDLDETVTVPTCDPTR